MKRLLFFLIICSLMAFPVSADTVDIEVWENADGVYFLSVEGEDLQECDGTLCEVEIDADSTLTDDDIEEISGLIYEQLEDDGVGQGYAKINDSQLRAITNDVVEGGNQNLQAWITNTYMPTAQQYQNCTVQLVEKEGALAVLDGKLQNHDVVVQGYEERISSLNRDVELYHFIILILIGLLGIEYLHDHDFIKSVRAWRRASK